jgi:predicted nucleotidyltransferase
VFTPTERDRLRDRLVSDAQADDRIIGAALTGSTSVGRDDRWSDIDLAVSVGADAHRSEVMSDWTARMYADHAALTHLDLHRGATVYRVYLLASTIQVDIAFSPASEFGAIDPTFRLLFGAAKQPRPAPEPVVADLIGMGWLYALHARSSIERGRVWQAEYMISGIRERVLALACVRHGLPATQGRGVDRLPPEATEPIRPTLVRAPDVTELRRAFRAATAVLLAEIGHADAALAERLNAPLRELAG